MSKYKYAKDVIGVIKLFDERHLITLIPTQIYISNGKWDGKKNNSRYMNTMHKTI